MSQRRDNRKEYQVLSLSIIHSEGHIPNHEFPDNRQQKEILQQLGQQLRLLILPKHRLQSLHRQQLAIRHPSSIIDPVRFVQLHDRVHACHQTLESRLRHAYAQPVVHLVGFVDHHRLELEFYVSAGLLLLSLEEELFIDWL